jgi:hypothetical protein
MPDLLARPVRLAAAQRHRLKKIARGHKSPHRDKLRAQIVLDASRGHNNARIARARHVTEDTVRKWRGRSKAIRRWGPSPTLAHREGPSPRRAATANHARGARVRIGTATSLRSADLSRAEIYPDKGSDAMLTVTEEQEQMLLLFA